MSEEVFNLDRAAAEERAKRRPWEVVYGDRKWLMQNAFNLDLELLERAENGDISAIREALQQGLGDQYAAFRAAQRLDLAALTILFNEWIKQSGAEPGESPASSVSSVSMERPSNPTWSGSTASASQQPFGEILPAGVRHESS